MKPIIKWAGGKTRLLPAIRELLPQDRGQWYEPFAGGLAVTLDAQPDTAIIGDLNPELINFYRQIRDSPGAVFTTANAQPRTKTHYHTVRGLDRYQDWLNQSPITRAARFLYLNKTGFNGLWRVNRKGQCNTPYGTPGKGDLCDYENLKQVADYLRNHVTIRLGDYQDTLADTQPGDFTYLDPPYLPLSNTANFTSYTAQDFTDRDQMELADTVRDLDRQGVKFMLSSPDVPAIRELYKNYRQTKVEVNRSISCKSETRRNTQELIITNY